MLKYDIRRPSAEGDGFEERSWSPANFPVLGPDGHVAYILHTVKDVTPMVRLEQDASATNAANPGQPVEQRAAKYSEPGGRIEMAATVEGHEVVTV